MKEQSKLSYLSYNDITTNLNTILKQSKNNRIIAPQQRSKYESILQWLNLSLSTLSKNNNLNLIQLNQQHKIIILSCLQQMIMLTKTQCIQKSKILTIIMQSIICILNNNYHNYQTLGKQLKYDYQHNTVKFQQQFLSQLKQITTQNQQLKRQKQHKWRNMYMLIKDNRIHRRQNKKYHKLLNQQIQKNINLAQQLIILRQQNQKMKMKINILQKQEVLLDEFMKVELALMQLQKKVKIYPNKVKKIIKDEMIKIQINQINNLDGKIDFIIKAIDQTGDIIDQYFDQYMGKVNFSYNISTQTDNNTEDKSTNTPINKQQNQQINIKPHDLIPYKIKQVYSLRIKPIPMKLPPKQDNTDTKMMYNTMGSLSLNKKTSFLKKQQIKPKFIQKKPNSDSLSICQSLRLTINGNKFLYIRHSQLFKDNYDKSHKLGGKKQYYMSLLKRKQINQQQMQTQQLEQMQLQAQLISKLTQQLCMKNKINNLSRLASSKLPQVKLNHFNHIKTINFHYKPAKSILKTQRLSNLSSIKPQRQSMISNIKMQRQSMISNIKMQRQSLVSYNPFQDVSNNIDKDRRKATIQCRQQEQDQNQTQKIEQIKNVLKDRKSIKNSFHKKKSVKYDYQQSNDIYSNNKDNSNINQNKNNNSNNTSNKLIKTNKNIIIQQQQSRISNIDKYSHIKSNKNIDKNAFMRSSKNIDQNTNMKSSKNIDKQYKTSNKTSKSLKYNGVNNQCPYISINYAQKTQNITTNNDNMIQDSKRLIKTPQIPINLTKLHQKHQKYSSTLTINMPSGENIKKVSKLSSNFRTSKRASTEMNQFFLTSKYNNLKSQVISFKDNDDIMNQNICQQLQKHIYNKNISFSSKQISKQKPHIIDFNKFIKIFQKILININIRHKQYIHYKYQLKTYLIYYFKHQYHKNIYNQFISYVIHSNQQICIFLSKLLNVHLPSAYLIQIFKTFCLVISKTYQLNYNPLFDNIPIQILQYLSLFYINNTKLYEFKSLMKTINKQTIYSWFICLLQQLNSNCLQNQLYKTMIQLISPLQKVKYQFIQQVTYFMTHNKDDNYKLFHYKILSGEEDIQLYKISLFCYKYQWKSLLNLKYTIFQEYKSKIGDFDIQKSIDRIKQNKNILQKFKILNKIYQKETIKYQRYMIQISYQLVKLIELNILQYRVRMHFPLNLELKFINFAYQGIEKKNIIQKIKNQ